MAPWGFRAGQHLKRRLLTPQDGVVLVGGPLKPKGEKDLLPPPSQGQEMCPCAVWHMWCLERRMS